jgi:hypothetical protein
MATALHPCVSVYVPLTYAAVVVFGMKMRNGTHPFQISGKPEVGASMALGIRLPGSSSAAMTR